ncbi:hypothetical protein H8K35_17245 [Undibacterium sp. LX40W]|uniref:Alpha/beta hydrolase n=1 Tax=Undibacterium nitidum TaxID=2762298 RepID=A0A923HS92_9BURK|nr:MULTISPECIES: hypothetical protein [Undibacterium]MBC3883146.1 hypothetical protein [Undibacterium nitidum]MBC3893428.1 hypothetical protein [Undibacterium sp. LX40W]
MSKQLLFVDGVGGKKYMRGALIRHFERCGYTVHCFDYLPSKQSITQIKQDLTAAVEKLAALGEYDAIAYSFGGVILRMVLQELSDRDIQPRRLVLLASPLKAMRLSQRIRDWHTYHWMAGECGQLVADEKRMAAISVPPIPTASVYGLWPWLGALGVFAGFGFDHDGMVTADEACASEMVTRFPVSASHGFIPSNQEALRLMQKWFDDD